MGATSALKLEQVHDHVRTVLAIEMLCACQGVDLRAPHKPGKILHNIHQEVRKTVSPMMTDRPLYPDVDNVKKLIDNSKILSMLEKELV